MTSSRITGISLYGPFPTPVATQNRQPAVVGTPVPTRSISPRRDAPPRVLAGYYQRHNEAAVQAPPPGADDMRAMLQSEMLTAARRSMASVPSADPALVHAIFPYRPSDAKAQWPARRQEFGTLCRQWNDACRTARSGGEFLQHISALCDAELAALRGRPVNAEGSVFEFEITLQGPGKIKVWRMIGADGCIVLRRAAGERGNPGQPVEAAARRAAERRVLRNMFHAAGYVVGQKRPAEEIAGDADLRASKRHAVNEWNRSGKESFESMRLNWNAAHGKKKSGVAFLQHLSALCDASPAAENSLPVDKHGYIFQFAVEIEGVGKIDLWRLVDDEGAVYLRKAPALQEHGKRTQAYENACMMLRQEMMCRAKTSALAGDDIGVAPYYRKVATAQWRADCMRQFEPYFEAWNDARGTKQNGGVFLQHVSRCCDQELMHNRAEQIDREAEIFSYRVRTHEGAEELEVWRLIPRPGTVLLRKAPTPPDDRKDQVSVDEHELACSRLIGNMRTAAATSRRAPSNS